MQFQLSSWKVDTQMLPVHVLVLICNYANSSNQNHMEAMKETLKHPTLNPNHK